MNKTMKMNRELTDLLCNQKINLILEGKDIKLQAPKGFLNEQMLQLIRENKEALIEYLEQNKSSSIKQDIEFSFFDANGYKLFSAYYPSKIKNKINFGIVICEPYGQEKIRCNTLSVCLAEEISNMGFSVFKFDYYACGDSFGISEEYSMLSSLESIKFAISEFRKKYQIERVLLLGIRFGATLSLLYNKIGHIDGLILWNPILNGKFYLKELIKSQKMWINGSFAKRKYRYKQGLDINGFIISKRFRKELLQTRIKEFDNLPTLVLDSNINAFYYEYMLEKWDDVELYIYDENKFWIKNEDLNKESIIPQNEIEKIVNWLKSFFL